MHRNYDIGVQSLQLKYRTYDTNVKAALSSLLSGNGYIDLVHFYGCLGIPIFGKLMFSRLQELVGKDFKELLDKSMEKYIEEAREIAKQKNIISDRLKYGLTVQFDGGWSKDSHGKNFNANSCALPLIEASTQKIIALGVANRYCSHCKQQINKSNIGEKEHENCYKNYEGPSTGMEQDLAVKLIRDLNKNHDQHVLAVISDGDTKAYNALRNNFKWYIQKWNCLNHLIKNASNRMYELKKQQK